MGTHDHLGNRRIDRRPIFCFKTSIFGFFIHSDLKERNSDSVSLLTEEVVKIKFCLRSALRFKYLSLILELILSISVAVYAYIYITTYCYV